MLSRKTKFFLCFFVFITVFSLFISYLSGIVKPIIYSKCESEMKLQTEKHIADALLNIEETNLLTDIIDFKYDSNGSISSYSTDTYKTTMLRSTLSTLLINSFKGESEINLTIPVGTLSGIPFLYGIGKNFRFKLTEFSFVNLDVESDFSDSGINQTLYKLYLKVEATTYIKELFGKKKISISSRIPISETVLVGAVPDAYTVIVRASNDDEEDINDYGAQISE